MLWRFDQSVKNRIVPLVPEFLNTRCLTMLTILWSILVIGFGYQAQENILWLWGSSVMLLMQYITDVLDGEVGRFRNSGFLRWGFYMDHMLDFLFMSSLFIGYGFLVGEESFIYLLSLVVLVGALLSNTFLAFDAANTFRISYLRIGPTEARIFVILVNVFIIQYGILMFERMLPYGVALLFLYMIIAIYRAQKLAYDADIHARRKN